MGEEPLVRARRMKSMLAAVARLPEGGGRLVRGRVEPGTLELVEESHGADWLPSVGSSLGALLDLARARGSFELAGQDRAARSATFVMRWGCAPPPGGRGAPARSPWYRRAMARIAKSALLGAALLGLPGCNTNVVVPFPLDVGFQPLEPVPDAVAWPAPVNGDPYPETPPPAPPLTAPSPYAGWVPGHAVAYARAYVKASLVDTWAAMKLPAVCRLKLPDANDTWTPTLDVEPEFPVSFRIHYTVYKLLTIEWELTYREGPLQGTVDAPIQVGLRYQKTWGSDHLELESGSVVAYEVPGVSPPVTALEMVGYLMADTQGPQDVAGTLQNFYELLVAQVHGLSPPF